MDGSGFRQLGPLSRALLALLSTAGLASSILLATACAAWAEATTTICVPEASSKPVLSTNTKGECPAKGAKASMKYRTVQLPGTGGLETLSKILPHVSYLETGVAGKPTVQFSGVNIQVVSGGGKTNAAVNGEGNLVIGYDENAGKHQQTGSHNLILGGEQTFTSYGGILAGSSNRISAPFASVNGGEGNVASGPFASVSGGKANTASGEYDSVSGGYENAASSWVTAVSGGYRNIASGFYSAASGGSTNTASGEYSSVSGGNANTASGQYGSVSGGYANTAGGSRSSVSGGGANFANGGFSSVTGGENNQASAEYASIAGGQFNFAANYLASVSGGTENVAEGPVTWIGGGYENVDYEQATNASIFGGLEERAAKPFEAIP